jgi:hypothetical protein
VRLTLIRGGQTTGADPGFQVRGVHLKKLHRADGGTEIFLVFHVKNHNFTLKNHIFSNCEGSANFFGVFRVKNHDFMPKNHIFYNFSGGGGGMRRMPHPPWTTVLTFKTTNQTLLFQVYQYFTIYRWHF